MYAFNSWVFGTNRCSCYLYSVLLFLAISGWLTTMDHCLAGPAQRISPSSAVCVSELVTFFQLSCLHCYTSTWIYVICPSLPGLPLLSSHCPVDWALMHISQTFFFSFQWMGGKLLPTWGVLAWCPTTSLNGRNMLLEVTKPLMGKRLNCQSLSRERASQFSDWKIS